MKWSGGEEDSYLLEVRREGSPIWKCAYEGSFTTTTLTNLRPSTKYTVRLSSATDSERVQVGKESRAAKTFSEPSMQVIFETRKRVVKER